MKIFYSLIIILSGFCCVGNFYDLHFFLNETNSNPYSLFIGSRASVIRKEMYVAASLAKEVLKGRLVIKKVQGLPGDGVQVMGQTVFLDGKNMGSIQSSSLSAISATIIPPDYYFLSSENKEFSFDSRYAEFGLVKTDNIKYQLWPIF